MSEIKYFFLYLVLFHFSTYFLLAGPIVNLTGVNLPNMAVISIALLENYITLL